MIQSLHEKTVLLIRLDYLDKVRQKDISKEYDLPISTINGIIHNRTYRDRFYYYLDPYEFNTQEHYNLVLTLSKIYEEKYEEAYVPLSVFVS